MSDSHPPPLEREKDLNDLLVKVADLEADGPLTIPERLRLLFEFIRTPDGDYYRQTEIAELSQGEVQHWVISKIINNQVVQPKLQTLQALARAFKVPLTYFTDPGTGSVLREELRKLSQAAAAIERLDRLEVVSTNLRTTPETDALLHRVAGLVEGEAGIAAANLAALASLCDVLEQAQAAATKGSTTESASPRIGPSPNPTA